MPVNLAKHQRRRLENHFVKGFGHSQNLASLACAFTDPNDVVRYNT
jgi:hypothetical protein